MYFKKLNSGDDGEAESESIDCGESESSEQELSEGETCENNDGPEKSMEFIPRENLEEELKALEEEIQIDIEELKKQYLKKDCEENQNQDDARREVFVIESGSEPKMSIISLPSYFEISADSDDDPDYEPESEDEQLCSSYLK
ncbi:hypothetical protein T10_5611 [Trichinella papuae]|uniref:Uncharacterized protein n=1 Tax=Trichinella papuae TaxID=268474 RepID=A0A0V1N0M0_9BILA|nr:hypothetical protein T10_5611 [Trichinella papuae]